MKNNVVFGVATRVLDDECGKIMDEYTIVWHHLEWILSVIIDIIPRDVCIVRNDIIIHPGL